MESLGGCRGCSCGTVEEMCRERGDEVDSGRALLVLGLILGGDEVFGFAGVGKRVRGDCVGERGE